jgi:hypothetical protein
MMSFTIKVLEASKLLISDLYSAWRYGGLADVAGVTIAMNAGISWLCRVQDSSATADGARRGISARRAAGCPPTLRPTATSCRPSWTKRHREDSELQQRAERMLDRLCAIMPRFRSKPTLAEVTHYMTEHGLSLLDLVELAQDSLGGRLRYVDAAFVKCGLIR